MTSLIARPRLLCVSVASVVDSLPAWTSTSAGGRRRCGRRDVDLRHHALAETAACRSGRSPARSRPRRRRRSFCTATTLPSGRPSTDTAAADQVREVPLVALGLRQHVAHDEELEALERSAWSRSSTPSMRAISSRGRSRAASAEAARAVRSPSARRRKRARFWVKLLILSSPHPVRAATTPGPRARSRQWRSCRYFRRQGSGLRGLAGPLAAASAATLARSCALARARLHRLLADRRFSARPTLAEQLHSVGAWRPC